MLEIIIDDIKKTLDDFYKLTKIPISIYDEDMKPIYHAAGMTPVCYAIRRHPLIKKRCSICEKRGQEICYESRKAHVYRCHTGFVEANIPICENNVIIGYLLTGQILCDENVEFVKAKLTDYANECSVDPDDFIKLLELSPVMDSESINAAVNMIEMCASYLYLSKIIKKKSYVLSAQLKEYIDSHLTEDLTIKHLCDKMFVSKTKLYRLSLKSFGMGCSEYILQKRIELAKTLLETSDKSIYEIAEEVGFKDTNYFTRIFKKLVGMTPSQYKKQK